MARAQNCKELQHCLGVLSTFESMFLCTREHVLHVLNGVISVGGSVYEGVSPLMESGGEVLESLKEGLGSGQKRSWYPAVKVASAFAQAGQLKDLKVLIVEAPCRRDPLFQ